MPRSDILLADFLPVADVQVDMSKSGKSETTISSDALGPCLAFLLVYQHSDQQFAFLNHYSFDEDESNFTNRKVIARMLNHICEGFKKKIKIDLLQKHPEISFVHLLVAGGAIGEADLIKYGLSTFNYYPYEIKHHIIHTDDHYLYLQLLNKVTIVESVSKMLDDEEEGELEGE